MFGLILKIGLTAILVFTPLARGTTTTRIWAITPVLLMIYTLVFLWLWRVNNRVQISNYKFQISRTTLDKPILAFVILAIISFVFSIYKHDSFYALVRLFAYVGLFYLIVNNYSRELRRYLVGLVICIGTGLSIYGLLQYFGILPHSWWSPENCLAATYVNHNHFAGYLELVIPVAAGVLLKEGLLRRSASGGPPRNDPMLISLLILSLIVMIAAFMFAQSRGAWVSLGFSLLVMNMVLIKKKILKRESILIFILFVSLIFAFFYSSEGLVSKRMETVKEISTGEASWDTRLNIWQGTARMIKDKPLIGVGIGDFVWGFPRYRPVPLNSIKANYVHNDYLHMAAEMGMLAPVIMVWMLVIVLRKGLGYEEHVINPVMLGCAIGMFSLALHNLIDFNFHIPANMILFITYGGVIMGDSSSNV